MLVSRRTMSSESRIVLPLKAIPGGARLRAAREHERGRRHTPRRPGSVDDEKRVLVLERRRPVEQRHVVAEQLVADHGPLALDDVARSRGEVVHRDLVLQPVALAVDRPLAHPRQIEDRLTDRLRRDRAGVDELPPSSAGARQGDAPPQLRGLDRRLLSRRPGADDDSRSCAAPPPRSQPVAASGPATRSSSPAR